MTWPAAFLPSCTFTLRRDQKGPAVMPSMSCAASAFVTVPCFFRCFTTRLPQALIRLRSRSSCWDMDLFRPQT